MVTPQFLPIPKAIHALACETISRRVDRLPFTRNDVEITEGIVGITLECLNAEVMRTLPLKTVARGTGTHPGLAECLSERRGSDQGGVAPVIAEVLVNAGLAEPAEVLDTATHTQIRGSGSFPHGPGISGQENFPVVADSIPEGMMHGLPGARSAKPVFLAG